MPKIKMIHFKGWDKLETSCSRKKIVLSQFIQKTKIESLQYF